MKAAAWFALGLLAAAAVDAHAEERVLRLVRGQSRIDAVPGIHQVAVGDPRIADVRVVSSGKELLTVGLAEGMTTLDVWRGGSSERWLVRVLARDPRLLADDLTAMLRSLPGVAVEIAGERVLLTGRTVGAGDSRRIETLLALYPDVLDFVERHRVDLDVLIRIDVQLVEIRRGRQRDIGVVLPTRLGAAAEASLHGNMVPGVGPFGGSVVVTQELAAGLNVLEESGHARSLARPALVSRSGKPASFRAGGMLPVPVASGPGQVSVDWKPYGVAIDVLPRVDDAGNFDLELGVESSDLDHANAVGAAGGSVPALRARTMRSTINLRAGQSLVLAELHDRQESKNVDGVAGLSRLPILGELFKRRRWGSSDAETYLIVTPTLAAAGTGTTADEALRRWDAAGPEVRPGLSE